MTVAWDHVTRNEVLRAIQEYDQVGPEKFFSAHGFAPTTTYDLVWDERRCPPKAILGAAYEFATGQRLASGDFEGGKTGAVRVLEELGIHRPGATISQVELTWLEVDDTCKVRALQDGWLYALGDMNLHVSAEAAWEIRKRRFRGNVNRDGEVSELRCTRCDQAARHGGLTPWRRTVCATG